jgi:hypothetical protein
MHRRDPRTRDRYMPPYSFMLNSFFLSFERGRMLSFFACGQVVTDVQVGDGRNEQEEAVSSFQRPTRKEEIGA